MASNGTGAHDDATAGLVPGAATRWAQQVSKARTEESSVPSAWLYKKDKLVVSLDIGNSFSSVSYAHLQWKQEPRVRTVTSFPSTSSSTGSASTSGGKGSGGGGGGTRCPSAITYSLREQPLAFGSECARQEHLKVAHESGWTTVRAWKRLLLEPDSTEKGNAPSGQEDKQGSPASSTRKLVKKRLNVFGTKSASKGEQDDAASVTTSKSLARLGASPSTASLLSLPAQSLDRASSGSTDLDGAASAKEHQQQRTGKEGKAKAKAKGQKVYMGPLLKVVYCDFIKFLVDITLAHFQASTPPGAPIPQTTFIVTHPSSFSIPTLDMLVESFQLAKALPLDFDKGRIVFANESGAAVHFARQHVASTFARDEDWLSPGMSFVLCDAAEYGTSLTGFTVEQLSPRLRLRAYEKGTRLTSGSKAVTEAFASLLAQKTRKSSQGAEMTAQAMEHWNQHVLASFDDASESFAVRTAAGKEMEILGSEIEQCFKASVDPIIVRLSSLIPRGSATSILLVGGFGESPYLQRRLRETFQRIDVTVIIPDRPTHTAVSEGALRLYLAREVQPRRTRVEFGLSTSVDWSTHWQRGMERRVFQSVTGQRFILDRWSPFLPKGSPIKPDTVISKDYNVKLLRSAADCSVSVDLWTRDPERAPDAEWLTDFCGRRQDGFDKCCTVKADVSSLLAVTPLRGEPGYDFWQLDLELLVFVGPESLQACIAWQERGIQVRGPAFAIADDAW